ncbi:hypothetical protein QAD02_008087 [Eretmocerus hayati]|uniref:Uncharacterized protein n=1 Tax=Eretmocerus hayati TaxID=131215 RepID=A0ACC2N5G5_9HYME|nr:hypothetical protein QAD02_008087 [Eretmocerus hayati]
MVGYFVSHSRGSEAEVIPEGGVACFVLTSDLVYLHNLIVRNMLASIDRASGTQFNFTEIDVQITDRELNDRCDSVDVSNDNGCEANNDGLDISNECIEQVPENAICDISWIFDKLHEHFDNHSEDNLCNFSNLKFISTYNKGLSKSFKFKCENCGLIRNVSGTPNGSTNLDLNLSIIIGCLTIGIGQSQLEELLRASNIRCMSDDTYQKYHTNVAEHAILAAQRQMERNREDEIALAYAGEIIY